MQTSDQHTVIAVYQNLNDAEHALLRLLQASYPMAQAAIVSQEWQVEQARHGAHDPGPSAMEGLRAEGARGGAGMGAIFGTLFGFCLIPLTGGLALPGVLAGIIASGVGGTVLGTAMGRGAGSLCMVNILSEYEQWLTDGKFIVLVHGTPEEIHKAHALLDSAETHHIAIHPFVWE